MSFGGMTSGSATGGGASGSTFGVPTASGSGVPVGTPPSVAGGAAGPWAGGRAGRSRTLSPACRAAKWSAARSAIAAGSGPSPIVMLLYGRIVPFARWKPAMAML